MNGRNRLDRANWHYAGCISQKTPLGVARHSVPGKGAAGRHLNKINRGPDSTAVRVGDALERNAPGLVAIRTPSGKRNDEKVL